jgi:hypothetical protein
VSRPLAFFILYALLAMLLGITGHVVMGSVMLGGYALLLLGLGLWEDFRGRQ